MTAALEGGEWSAARPSRILPLGKTRYPFYRRVGGPQERTGGKSRHHRDSIPDRPASSQSLYPLSYQAHPTGIYGGKKGSLSGFSLCMSLSVSFYPCCFTRFSSVYYQHYIILATEGTVKQKTSLSD